MAQNTRRNQSTTKATPAPKTQAKPAAAVVEGADDKTLAEAGSTAEDTTETVVENQGGVDSGASPVEPSASVAPDAVAVAPANPLGKFVDPTTAPVEAAAAAAPVEPVVPTGAQVDTGNGDVEAVVVADVYSVVTTGGRRYFARKGDTITTSAAKVQTGIANRLLRKA